MTTKKNNSLTKQKHSANPAAKGIGGREFGNVIEPTQAQMASGNEGLAASPTPSTRKKSAHRKKAA